MIGVTHSTTVSTLGGAWSLKPIRNWLAEHAPGYTVVQGYTYDYHTVYFKQENDKFLFDLAWSERIINHPHPWKISHYDYKKLNR